jgi:hypothetical protein
MELPMLTFDFRKEQGPDFGRELKRLAALTADMEGTRKGIPPERLAGGDAPVLDRWMLGVKAAPCLAGLSTGHPLLPGENRMIGTSALWLMSEDKTWARTLSRWYRLGRPLGDIDLQS